MIHKILNNAQFAAFGGFTDLFILGTTRRQSGSTVGLSDFTTVGLTQAITLLTLAIGDVVQPDAIVEVKTNFAGATTTTGSLGVTGSLTLLTAATDMKATAGKPVVPLAAAQAYAAQAAIALTFNVVVTVDTVDVHTAGEVWIWLRISRIKDRVTDRLV